MGVLYPEALWPETIWSKLVFNIPVKESSRQLFFTGQFKVFLVDSPVFCLCVCTCRSAYVLQGRSLPGFLLLWYHICDPLLIMDPIPLWMIYTLVSKVFARLPSHEYQIEWFLNPEGLIWPSQQSGKAFNKLSTSVHKRRAITLAPVCIGLGSGTWCTLLACFNESLHQLPIF